MSLSYNPYIKSVGLGLGVIVLHFCPPAPIQTAQTRGIPKRPPPEMTCDIAPGSYGSVQSQNPSSATKASLSNKLLLD